MKEKGLDGGEGQNRTADTTIFSRMLYQLSYLATLWKTLIVTRTVNRETSRSGSGFVGGDLWTAVGLELAKALKRSNR